MRYIIPFIVLFITGPVSAEPSRKADFYVSLAGSDNWSGSLPEPNPQGRDGPFATLKRARDAVRDLKSRPSSEDIVVLIRGGLYRLGETVVFGLEDSAEGDSTITYEAYPGETPVFSSGQEVRGWSKVTGKLPGPPDNARGKVFVADVPRRFFTLYDTTGRLPRARSSGFIPLGGGSRDTLHFPAGRLRNWPNVKDVEIVVRPHHAWIVNILPLVSVDEQTQIARTSIDATYAMNQLHFLKDTESCWVENALEELDEPGEWVLDTKEGKLYLWPRGDTPPLAVMAPQLTEFIRVEGGIDKMEPKDVPVRNLCFRGLTFMHGERYQLTQDDAGLQHDWDMHDKANALVTKHGLKFGISTHLYWSPRFFNTARQYQKPGTLEAKLFNMEYDPKEYASQDSWNQHWYDRCWEIIEKYDPDMFNNDAPFPDEKRGKALGVKLFSSYVKVLFYFNSAYAYPFTSYSKAFTRQRIDQHPELKDFLLADPGTGELAHRRDVFFFDVLNPELRKWWTDTVAKGVADSGCDGAFIDQMHGFAWLRKDKSGAVEKAMGDMMASLKTKMGQDKILLCNNANQEIARHVFPVTDASMFEHYNEQLLSKESLLQDWKDMLRFAKAGKMTIFRIGVEQDRGQQGTDEKGAARGGRDERMAALARERLEYYLACYLIGAQPYSYFQYGWGWTLSSGSLQDYPELHKPLGAPRGPYQRTTPEGWEFTREFEHAHVSVDTEKGQGKITWRE